jgi:hypothetical protein
MYFPDFILFHYYNWKKYQYLIYLLFFYHGSMALAGQALLIVEDSWAHSDTPQLVGILWMSDQPNAETSTK